jgi:hypothetical protein
MGYDKNKRCVDCGRRIDDRAKRCVRCFHIYRKGLPGNRRGAILPQKLKDKISISLRGKKNPSYKDGRCSKLYRCKRCHMPIHMYTYLHGRKLCQSCSKIGRHNPMNYRKTNTLKHHIYKKENGCETVTLTDRVHSKLHSRAYDFVYEQYGEEGIRQYFKWFYKKFGIKII